MDLERALEVQRVKLLRLLTGWFGLVALMSVAALAVPMPRAVRAFLADVLIRAECAAQCMVRVSARIQAGDAWREGGAVPAPALPAPALPAYDIDDDVPSTANLLRRMKALRRVLRDLPRFGRRLLRRLCRKVGTPAVVYAAPEAVFEWALPQWTAPVVDRPPD